MGTVLRLIIWLWKAWPLLVFVPIGFEHWLVLHYFPENAISINKTISLLTQLLGGLLILYSINSNIGVIKKKSLLNLLGAYFREFPLISRTITVEAVGSGSMVFGGKAKIVVTRNPQSVEEKLDYLQEQINGLKRELEEETKELNEKIDRQSKKLSIEIQTATSALRNVESKMDEISTGGVKVQFFGVLLMVYGAFTGYVA